MSTSPRAPDPWLLVESEGDPWLLVESEGEGAPAQPDPWHLQESESDDEGVALFGFATGEHRVSSENVAVHANESLHVMSRISHCKRLVLHR